MPGADDKLESTFRLLDGLGVGVAWLAYTPAPLLGLTWGGRWSDPRFGQAALYLGATLPKAFGRQVGWPNFRCVGLDRLPVVLRSGCDVEPSNAVMFMDHSPGKALEYGDRANKVMLLFNAEQLRNSHREVPADLDPTELAELARDHPSRLVSEDGTHLWLSRLPEGDRRINTPYEVEYARWIPGDPWKALQGVIVLGHEAQVIDRVRQDMADCRDVPWRMTKPTPG